MSKCYKWFFKALRVIDYCRTCGCSCYIKQNRIGHQSNDLCCIPPEIVCLKYIIGSMVGEQSTTRSDCRMLSKHRLTQNKNAQSHHTYWFMLLLISRQLCSSCHGISTVCFHCPTQINQLVGTQSEAIKRLFRFDSNLLISNRTAIGEEYL